MSRPDVEPLRHLKVDTARSASISAYGSFLSRTLMNLTALLGAARYLSPSELTVWYLFLSVSTFSLVLDVGFTPTLVRVFSYRVFGSGPASLSDLDHRSIQQGVARVYSF
jgi:hypothetical protein